MLLISKFCLPMIANPSTSSTCKVDCHYYVFLRQLFSLDIVVFVLIVSAEVNFATTQLNQALRMEVRVSLFSLAVAIMVAASHIQGSASLAVMSVDLSSEWLKIALVKVGSCIIHFLSTSFTNNHHLNEVNVHKYPVWSGM